jgi:hypothetical protein
MATGTRPRAGGSFPGLHPACLTDFDGHVLQVKTHRYCGDSKAGQDDAPADGREV